jgi:hypothetical protein
LNCVDKSAEVYLSRPGTKADSAQGSANRVEDFLIARKSNPALLGDEPVIDPNSELAGLSADCFGVDVEFFLQQRRYTSGARRI